MVAMTVATQRFVRRTSLNENEYRTNFRQIDCDVIAALTSEEASQVTSQMSKVYLSLVNSPSRHWEREGVLLLTGEEREGKWQTAWEQLTSLAGVASATARKAIAWMHGQGIIGYFAGKNGVGIRIFFNRAASSIGQKSQQDQKNLRLVRASNRAPHTSRDEAPFKDSFAVLENLDSDFNPHAPESGAAEENAGRELPGPDVPPAGTHVTPSQAVSSVPSPAPVTNVIDSAEVVERVVRKIIPHVRAATAHEHERTREWFITHALPKAVRVSQRSAYDVLRARGLITEPRPGGSRSTHIGDRGVGKHVAVATTPRTLADEEITELAESCVALLVTQGQAIDCTLSGMGVEVGGFLLPEDATKVRARAELLIPAGGGSSTQ